MRADLTSGTDVLMAWEDGMDVIRPEERILESQVRTDNGR